MPCNKWGWPQVLTSPGMAFQAVERSHSQPLDPWIYPPTQGQSQIEGLGWDSHDNNPVGCWLDWYICIHTHRKEKFGNSSSLLLDGIGEFFGRLFWKKNPYEKMVVQTKKLQKLQPINQFVESIFFWPSLKKNPKNSGPSAPKTKDQETSPGSFISKKKWFPKKILQTKKSIKQFQETYSKFRSFSQKKTNRSQNFLWISSRSPGPGAFYITVARAIASSSDAAETVLRRRLVPSEGGKLWCFDIRGAGHEMRGERKDVFRCKTKKQPRMGSFLEVEWVFWLFFFCLVLRMWNYVDVACCCFVFEVQWYEWFSSETTSLIKPPKKPMDDTKTHHSVSPTRSHFYIVLPWALPKHCFTIESECYAIGFPS